MNKWIKAKLGDIGTFSTSSVDKKYNANEQAVYLVNYMDVYRNNTIDSSIEFMEVTASKAEIARSKVALGDVLFTPSSETPDDIGHSAVVAESLANTLHSYHTVRFRPHDKDTLDLKFAAWFCHTNNIRKQFERKCAGSTRYTLSIPSFRSVDIEIPESLDVQRKIAVCLDTIGQAIEKTEALIEKYQQIKAGLMHDLFTRGIGVDGKLRPPREQAPELYQQTPIGWIPKEWELPVLGDYIGPINSGWSPTCESDNAGLNEWGVLKTTAVVWDGYEPSENKKLPKELTGFHSIETKAGDILITRKGPVDRVGVVVCVPETPRLLMFPDTVFRTRVIDPEVISPEYLALSLQSEKVQKFWWQRKVGLAEAQVNLNHGILKKTPFPKPKAEEQFKILERYYCMMLKKKSLELELRSKQQIKDGLMHDLLTGKVPVKVDEPEAPHV